MWLLKEMRDPHTNVWLENFLGSKNLLSYYGSAALDLHAFPEWDSVLKELIQKPGDVVIVEVKASGQGKGLSKNNPYRETENDTNFEIEIDIEPASLANRILSVRSKIAKEWASDLELVISANDNILPSYVEKNKHARKSKDKKSKKKEGSSGSEVDQDSVGVESSESGGKKGHFGQRNEQRFDRDAIYFINNHPAFGGTDASPLRASSFDLLFLLSLQESIHRILERYHEAGEEKEVSFAWLKNFYSEGLENYFDGNQSFGRADDFMDDLLSTSPALKTIGDKMGFIDPLKIAEDIISVREDVAIEWKELMENAELDHTGIRADVFRVQMEKWGQKTTEPKVPKKNFYKNMKTKRMKKKKEPKRIVIQGGDFE